jgi:endogenous inhibitor of DNA gyrase (YacG/DUF329 family)
MRENDDRDPSHALMLANDSFGVECPDCGRSSGRNGSESHAVGITADGFQAEVILISNGPTNQTQWWQIRQHHESLCNFEGRSCPECDEPLTNADFREDESAPEVGWEYYECPECGAHLSLGAV